MSVATEAPLPGATSEAVTPRPRRGTDRVLLAAVGALLLLGLLAIGSAGASTTLPMATEGVRMTPYLQKHLVWLVIGLLMASVTYALPYRLWQRYSLPLFLGLLVVLGFLALFGKSVNGSERWLLGGSIQPGELAKLVVIVYLADWLAGRGSEIRRWAEGIVPYSILLGLASGLIILQRDYSTAVLIMAVASAMLFVAGADLRQMVLAGAAAGVVLVFFVVSEQYRMQRVRSFLHPEDDPWNSGYQILQALSAFRDGGLLGAGLGNGQIKFAFPFGTAHTDAIFAVVAEETGVLGCLLFILLFGIVGWRGFRAAAGAPDRFGALVAAGITTWLVLQALVNMAVVARVVPFTGIPMPLISYGGSSLVTCLAGIGLLLGIARRSDPTRAKAHGTLDLGGRNRRSRLSRAHRARRLGPSG